MVSSLSRDIGRVLCEIEGVASVQITQGHDRVIVELAHDSATVIGKVRTLMHTSYPGIAVEFAFPREKGFSAPADAQ